jgi:hypothetical protein
MTLGSAGGKDDNQTEVTQNPSSRQRSHVARPRKRLTTQGLMMMTTRRTNFPPPKAMLSKFWPKRLARAMLNSSKSCMKSACVRPARWARSAMSRTKKARRGMTQLEQPPFAAKAMAAVIRVGDGRGFVIARAGIPNRSARQAPHQQYMQCNMEYRT